MISRNEVVREIGPFCEEEGRDGEGKSCRDNPHDKVLNRRKSRCVAFTGNFSDVSIFGQCFLALFLVCGLGSVMSTS